MIEEEKDIHSTITSEDMDALRILLHSVKGLSPVSSVTTYVPVEDQSGK